MKIILIKWSTGEILEKGVLSAEYSKEHWIAVYSEINIQLLENGFDKVWLVAP